MNEIAMMLDEVARLMKTTLDYDVSNMSLKFKGDWFTIEGRWL